MSRLPPIPPGFELVGQTPPPPEGFVPDLPPIPQGFVPVQGTSDLLAVQRMGEMAATIQPDKAKRQQFIDEAYKARMDRLARANAQRPGVDTRSKGQKVAESIGEVGLNIARVPGQLLIDAENHWLGIDRPDLEAVNLGAGYDRNFDLDLPEDDYTKFAEEQGRLYDAINSPAVQYAAKRRRLGETLLGNFRRNNPDADDQAAYQHVHEELSRLGFNPSSGGKMDQFAGIGQQGVFERSMVGEGAAGVARGFSRVSTGGAGMILGTLAEIENTITDRRPEAGFGIFDQMDANTSQFHADLQHSLRASDVASEFNPGSARWWIANASEQGALWSSFVANPTLGTVVVGLSESSVYHDMKEQLTEAGIPIQEARLKALGGAAAVAVTNSILDRIGFGGVQRASQMSLRGGVSGWVRKWMAGGMGEGVTEGLQELNSVLVEAGITGDNVGAAEIKRIFAAAGSGGLMGLLFGLANVGGKPRDTMTQAEQAKAQPAASPEALEAEINARMEAAGITQPAAAEHAEGAASVQEATDPNQDGEQTAEDALPNAHPDAVSDFLDFADNELGGPGTENLDAGGAAAPLAGGSQTEASQTIPGTSTAQDQSRLDIRAKAGARFQAEASEAAAAGQKLTEGIADVQQRQAALEARLAAQGIPLDQAKARAAAAAAEEAASVVPDPPKGVPKTLKPDQVVDQMTAVSPRDPGEFADAEAQAERSYFQETMGYLKHGDSDFELVNLPLDMVETTNEPNAATVEAYTNQPGKDAPPVVGGIPKEGDGGRVLILDGKHRVAAARARGETSIPAYIPKADRVPLAKARAAARAKPGRRTDQVQGPGAADEGKDKAATKGPPGGEIPDPVLEEMGKRAWVDDDGKTHVVAGVSPEESKRRLRRVPIPELVKLAKWLMGNLPKVSNRFKSTLGMFQGQPGGEASVTINAQLGKHPRKLAKTLAHELGHLVDYLPDEHINRGNLIARLLVLKKYIQPVLGALDNQKLFNELYALSQKWRGPVDPKNDPPAYVKYRQSPVELYADFLSVLLNDPYMASTDAPTAFKAFLENLQHKPDVMKAYLDIQDLLNGVPEEKLEARRADFRESFYKGTQVLQARAAEIEAGKQDLRSLLLQNFVDSAQPLMKLQDKTAKDWKNTPNDIDMAADEFAMTDQETELMLSDVEQSFKPVIAAGMTLDDIGEFMMMNRIANGDRANYINPLGHTAETAAEQIADLKQRLGEEKAAILEKAVKQLGEINAKLYAKLHSEGAITDQQSATVQENKGTYATFAVLDHLDATIPAGIRQQIGTFKEVANPLVSTVMKMMSAARLYEVQRFKNKVVRLLKKGGELTPLKAKPGGTPKAAGPNMENFAHLVKGKVRWFQTHESFVRAMKRHDLGGVSGLSRYLNSGTYKIFHQLYVAKNLAWLLFNIPRDFMRTYKSLKGVGGSKVSIAGVFKAYLESAGPAWRHQKGLTDPLVRQIVEDRALASIQVAELQKTQEQLDYDKLLERRFGTPQKARAGLMGMAKGVYDLLEVAASWSESISKIAGYKVLTNIGVQGKKRAHVVRNKVGTPNIYRKGTATSLSNGLFMYSKVFLAGLRADASTAFTKETAGGWWMGHMMTVGLPRLAMKAAALGLFGEALKRMFEAIPEYEKTNYLIIPLPGLQVDAENKSKVAYLRLPMDHTDLLIQGLMWKLTDLGATAAGARESTIEKDLKELFHFGRSQVPGWSPPIEMATAWIEYLSGGNPYDSWRRRNIIPRDEMKAGGWASNKVMLQWTANQFGVLSTLAHPIIGNERQEETTTEKVIGTIPGVNRLIRFSDQGIDEKRWLNEELEEMEAARFRMSLPSNVKPLLQEWNQLRRFDTGTHKTKLESDEHRRRAVLNEFYKVYLEITKAIKAAESAGKKEAAQRLRKQLETTAENFK